MQGNPHVRFDEGGSGNGAMVEPLRHRQTKGAETDMPGLPPPRHIPTLPDSAVRPCYGEGRLRGNSRQITIPALPLRRGVVESSIQEDELSFPAGLTPAPGRPLTLRRAPRT